MSRSATVLTVVLALAPVSLALAGPASAATSVERTHLVWSADDPEAVVATCADGSQVGLGFDIWRNTVVRSDADGSAVSETRTNTYVGSFVHLTSGEVYTFRGTRIVTFDFVRGTFTSRGDYRTVTMPGAGVVLHDAGIQVDALEEELVLFSAGPKDDEFTLGADAVCSLFGLDG